MYVKRRIEFENEDTKKKKKKNYKLEFDIFYSNR